ncbi:MAG: thioredoxin family protein [Bacteroidales bacterium]|nr:thioredoxin family protein [Bacteroidales bacterium]
MKPVFFLLTFILLLTNCDNTKINKTKFDEKASDNVLIGYVNREGLKMEPFHEWFTPGYKHYQVNDSILKLIDKGDFRKNIKITIVLGTWCSDSRREVPRFYKILDHLEYNTKDLTVICVDTDKKAQGTNVDELNITRVPLFIFYRANKELGRIIESPKKSLEADMLEIVKKQ